MIKIERTTGNSEALKFIVEENDQKMIFGFSVSLLRIWGDPSEEKLKPIICAYIEKYGFSNEDKILRTYDVGGGGIATFLDGLKNFLIGLPIVDQVISFALVI